MKKILVPTDFSVCAEKALYYAVQMAKKADAEVLLLHVCNLLQEPFAEDDSMVNEYNDLIELNERITEYNDFKIIELNDRIDKLIEGIGVTEVKITTELGSGSTTGTILSVAKQNNIDLIVMGTLGATGIKTVLFGTKTATIIARCSIPVIAIPFDYEWKVPENILIALNEAEQDINLFEPVFTLARLFNAKISIAVFSEEKAYAAELMEHSRLIFRSKEKLTKRFPEKNIETFHLSGADFFVTLQEYIDKTNIDLLVMVTHKKGSIQNLLRLSMTRQMAYHTTVPLLSLPSQLMA